MAAVQCCTAIHSSQPKVLLLCLKAVADAGERAGPGLDADLMPPEQPSGSRWWNRLPGRGGGGGLGSRGGSQGDLQHGEAPLSAAQQARDRLSRYSHFLILHSRVFSCSPKIFSFLPLCAATACYYRNCQYYSMQCPYSALQPAVVLKHIVHAPVWHALRPQRL